MRGTGGATKIGVGTSRVLEDKERIVAIARHLQWLNGLMPSEAIKRDRIQRDFGAIGEFMATRCVRQRGWPATRGRRDCAMAV
jgi:hypothetical protein